MAAAGHPGRPRQGSARRAARHHPAVPHVLRDLRRGAEGPAQRDHACLITQMACRRRGTAVCGPRRDPVNRQIRRSGFEFDRVASAGLARFHGRAVDPELGAAFARDGAQDRRVPRQRHRVDGDDHASLVTLVHPHPQPADAQHPADPGVFGELAPGGIHEEVGPATARPPGRVPASGEGLPGPGWVSRDRGMVSKTPRSCLTDAHARAEFGRERGVCHVELAGRTARAPAPARRWAGPVLGEAGPVAGRSRAAPGSSATGSRCAPARSLDERRAARRPPGRATRPRRRPVPRPPTDSTGYRRQPGRLGRRRVHDRLSTGSKAPSPVKGCRGAGGRRPCRSASRRSHHATPMRHRVPSPAVRS